MAKKKLMLEEMLVPKAEIPYEVPENWCWVKLGNLVDLERGITFPGSAKKGEMEEGLIPCLRTANVQSKIETDDLIYIDRSYMKSNDNKLVREGDIIMSTANSLELVGKLAIVENINQEMTFGGFVLNIRNKGYISNKYLFYYLRAMFLLGKFQKIASQTTNIANINAKKIEDINIAIPPLAEQERIVKRIESIFEKVDKARELVDEARAGFEKRRAAILEKAFCGELTRKWREENGIKFNLEIKEFKDIATVKSNLVKPQEHMNHPHIAPDNIEKKTGKLLEYRTIEEDNVKSAKHKFYPNQILYSKIRPYLSKVVLVNFEGLCSADMYPIETELETKYLYWYMLSQKFVDYASNCGSRSVLPKLNQKELGSIPVPVFSKEEQIEIINTIDKLIKEENAIEDISDVYEHIEMIKKSILAKAFRGELNTANNKEMNNILLMLK